MKPIIIVAALILDLLGAKPAIAFSHSKDFEFPQQDCQEMFAGIGGLLKEADKEWAHLEKNPKDSPDAIELAANIQWYVDLAANYTTIFKAFCDKDKE